LIEDGWPPRRYGVARRLSDLPPVATASGVRLGSRASSPHGATLVGAGRLQANGVVFYEREGRVVELKSGTCGDF
jgi:hypothetical protein